MLTNDGVVSSAPELVFGPRFGSLSGSGEEDVLSDDGTFTYVPDTGFQGVDLFAYAVNIGQQRLVFSVRLYSGAVQLVAADNLDNALFVDSAVNRTIASLSTRDSGVGSHWTVSTSGESIQLESARSASQSKVLETWQPSGAGTDVSLYARNRRAWQDFRIQTSGRGNAEIVSQYTGLSVTRDVFGLTATEVSASLDDDWLIAGVGQTLPPSAFDDRYVGDVDALIVGNVLSNDIANSIDFASFLVSRPKHGEFVGIEQTVYDGLAPFGTFRYQPDPGFEGLDQFTYIAVGSGNGAPSRLVTVNLRVGNANNPVAGDDVFFTATDTAIAGRVLLNDTNAGGGFFDPQAVLISPPRFGQFFGINQAIYDGLAPFGDFEYQPDAGFNGVDSFAYRIINSGVPSPVATVYLIVGSLKFAPLENWRLHLGTSANSNRAAFQLLDRSDPEVNAFSIEAATAPNTYFLRYADKTLETWATVCARSGCNALFLKSKVVAAVRV